LLILAFESSAKAASVALLEGGTLLGESYQNTGLTHSQTLLPMADSLLTACGKTKDDITDVAVAAGPGSFTGVRIGVAAAKGFAWGRRLPCYGVSTLEAMARSSGITEGTVVCAMDARRSQVYTATFEASGGNLRRITDDRAISVEDLGKDLENSTNFIFLVGDGANLCYNILKGKLPLLRLLPEHRVHQRASGVALAAAAAIERGEAGDGAALVPNYIRLSQAERERLARDTNKKE